MLAISAQRIHKTFRTFLSRKEVLRNISLDIDEGMIFGILGSNGSGKTTLISIFSTLILPDKGSLKIFDYDSLTQSSKIKEIVNISSGNPNFPWNLTVYENLKYFAMLYGIPKKRWFSVVNENIQLLDLESYKDAKFETLSTGIKQRVSLAKSLLNEPKLLFLDEPMVGLDPEISIKIKEMIMRIHEEKGVTIVLTTHDLKKAEQLCDRIAFLREGQIIANATPDELKRKIKVGDVIAIKYQGEIDSYLIEKMSGVISCAILDGMAEIIVEDAEVSLDPLIKRFKDVRVKDISISQPDLEDVFLEFAK